MPPFDGPEPLGEDRVRKLPGGRVVAGSPCSGSEAVVRAENAAVEMYQFAALMLGDEAAALSLVENTVASVDVDPCADPAAAKGLVRERVLDGALEAMQRQDPAAFAEVPAALQGGGCIEDDAVPLSGAEIAELVAEGGPRAAARLAGTADAGAARGLCAKGSTGAEQRGYGAGDQSVREPIDLDHGSGEQCVPAGTVLAGFFPAPCHAGGPGLTGAKALQRLSHRPCYVSVTRRYWAIAESARRDGCASTTLRSEILLNFLLSAVHPKHIPVTRDRKSTDSQRGFCLWRRR